MEGWKLEKAEPKEKIKTRTGKWKNEKVIKNESGNKK